MFNMHCFLVTIFQKSLSAVCFPPLIAPLPSILDTGSCMMCFFQTDYDEIELIKQL